MSLAQIQKLEEEFIQLAQKASKYSVAIESDKAIGSGIVIFPDAILTNHHVIKYHKKRLRIITHDSKVINADSVFWDKKSDLAIIFVSDLNLIPGQIKDTNKLKRGQFIFSLGNQYGLGKKGELSFSYGIISGFDRSIKSGTIKNYSYYEELIQTDLPIVPGNSGGGLFDLDGNIVGINCLTEHGSKKIGFAIPINTRTKLIIKNLYKKKKIEYGFLGINFKNTAVGAKVTKIIPKTAASQCDIKPGDIILKYRNSRILNRQELSKKIKATPKGERVKIQLLRNHKIKIVEIFIGD